MITILTADDRELRVVFPLFVIPGDSITYDDGTKHTFDKSHRFKDRKSLDFFVRRDAWRTGRASAASL